MMGLFRRRHFFRSPPKVSFPHALKSSGIYVFPTRYGTRSRF